MHANAPSLSLRWLQASRSPSMRPGLVVGAPQAPRPPRPGAQVAPWYDSLFRACFGLFFCRVRVGASFALHCSISRVHRPPAFAYLPSAGRAQAVSFHRFSITTVCLHAATPAMASQEEYCVLGGCFCAMMDDAFPSFSCRCAAALFCCCCCCLCRPLLPSPPPHPRQRRQL
jgi:hypothetical protein